jgi:hypothetical protein
MLFTCTVVCISHDAAIAKIPINILKPYPTNPKAVGALSRQNAKFAVTPFVQALSGLASRYRKER